MALELENTGVYDAAQRNFDRLKALVPDTGGQSVGVRFGTVNVSWPGGSATSDTETITHGLGTTPVVALATLQSGGGTWQVVAAYNYTATTFQVSLHTDDASTPANTVVSVVAWLVIG